MSSVRCPIANVLLEDYTKATREYSEASDALGILVGQPEAFAEPKSALTMRSLRASPPAKHSNNTAKTWLSGQCVVVNLTELTASRVHLS